MLTGGCGVGGLSVVVLFGLAIGLGLEIGLPTIDDRIFFDAAFGLQAVVEGPYP